jgi:hypothetical protein
MIEKAGPNLIHNFTLSNRIVIYQSDLLPPASESDLLPMYHSRTVTKAVAKTEKQPASVSTKGALQTKSGHSIGAFDRRTGVCCGI